MKLSYLLPILLAACATTQVRTVPEAQRRTTVETSVAASLDRTWSTMVAYVAAERLSIKTAERASGLIVTESAPAPSPTMEGQFAYCAPVNGRQYAPSTVTATFHARGDGARVIVRATAVFLRYDGQQCESSGLLEETWEREIKAMAERP